MTFAQYLDLIRKESPEILEALVFFLVAFLIHFGIVRAIRQLLPRFSITSWQYRLTKALRAPILVFLWIIAVSLILNLFFCQLSDSSASQFLEGLRKLGFLFVLTWFLLRWGNEIKKNLTSKWPPGEQLAEKAKIELISKLCSLTILIIASLLSLQILGFNLATIVTLGGVSGLVLGFASKDVLSNFFGGLMLYLTRPFNVGDLIESPDRKINGTIEEISWYYTRVRGSEKEAHYVPNSVFSTIIVTNISRRSHWTIEETIGLRYQDLKHIQKIIKDIKHILKTHPEVDHKQPIRVHLSEFAESSVNITFTIFTKTTKKDSALAVKEDILFMVAEVVSSHGADFAFQTTTLEIPTEIKIVSRATETPS